MKAISSLPLLPLVLAIGACSSSSSSNGNQNGTTHDAGGGASASGGDSSDDGGGSTGPMVTSYEAKLSGANVAPSPVVTSAKGDAKLGLESDGQTLDYDITQNVPNATSVNLHIGAPLENGNVAHQLTPISQHMSGKVTLTSDEATALAADQLYIDIPSQADAGGEIRGQITAPGSTIFTATPQGAQEVPQVLSNYAAHASFILSQDGTNAVYHIVTGATPTNVLLVRAIATINGQVVYPLMPTGQTIDGTLTLASGDQADFQANHFYVNILTSQNPTGELRGQIIPSGSTLYSGALLGRNEVPPVTTQATGGAQFVLSPDQKTVAYEIDVNGIIPTSADMDNGGTGKNGPTLYQLTLDQDGAQGSINYASDDVPMLQQGLTYANVHTASNPSGELRAQLVSHSN
jgi:hypothetical protein